MEVKMPTDRRQRKSESQHRRAHPTREARPPHDHVTTPQDLRPRTAVVLDQDPGWLDVINQTLVRLGLRVAGTALDPAQALALIREHRPDLLVIDVRTRGRKLDSVACLRKARQEAPELKAVVLSDEDDHEHIEAALRAGASAYIAKPTDPSDLATAIRQVFHRSIFPATSQVESAGSAFASARSDQEGLTARELEVLRHVAAGRSNVEIARKLWITDHTVKFHLSNAYKKLGVVNRTQACRRAGSLGLLANGTDANVVTG
jgi:DNA-binding NarL/FixJ family response regulator